jgi:uncharacterized membrane protein
MSSDPASDVSADPFLPVRQVGALAPFGWLERGWSDFARAPLPGLVHGLAVAIGGWIVLLIGTRHWSLLAGAFSGFVLVAPILATGLYETSRLHALGRRAGLREAMAAWGRGTRPLVWLGLLLGAAGTAWVLVSAGLFAFLVRAEIHGPLDFLRYVVHEQSTLLYAMWTLLGGLGAAIVFAATAVSPPLLLSHRIDLRRAILTSVRAVGENPMAMGVWATLIMVATALSIASLMLGFVITIPVIGHATWHAFEDLVDASGAKAR